MTRRTAFIGTLLAMLASMLLLLSMPASADALQLTAGTPRVSLEGRLEHFADNTDKLTFDEVRQQRFTRMPDFRSLGYGRNAHWFHAEVSRASAAPSSWILDIGSPELEEVDVWVEQRDGSYRQYAMGYHRPYENRPLQTRLFAVPFDAFADTQIYFRVRTSNAINVHAEIWQPGAFVANETQVNFYRGLYFGILLIAVLLYAILGARLHDISMAAYAGYVASQALFNLGTNGYLPVLLASHGPWFTDALPRIGWLGGAMAIVLMWDSLLDLKRNYPRIHRLYQFTILLNLALLPFALMPFLVTSWLLGVVKLANFLNDLNFVINMILMLVFWWRSRRVELMLYFVAFIIPAVGTLVNNAVNLGTLPQNIVTSNLYQLAPLIHVLVMSFGLALRLRQLQYDKKAAEQEVAVSTQRSEEQRRFVAMLSHEFRNPLAAIDRSAEMIQIKTRDLPPPETLRLAQIRNNVATLSGFVDNFLMTEALDHGALALSREPCAIRPLLETAIHLQGEAASQRVLFRVFPGDAAFNLDPTLIGVAVGNLLANALRYSPPESPVEVNVTLDDKGLRIGVADHGPGLDEEELHKLGTPYFRAASSAGKKGSGLGYHFTQRIVEAHSGTLTTRSRAGAGLEVEIFLA